MGDIYKAIIDGLSERIEAELEDCVAEFDRPPFSAIPTPLLDPIKSFFLRKGKRLRPTLFILSNAAYAERAVENIYTAAVALELLHNFILIHDDIVDHSDLRRSKPAMHTLLRESIASFRGPGVEAQNMAMIVGDMVYALAIQLFMTVAAPAEAKVAALRRLTEAALYTASGELREMLNSLQPIEELTASAIRETACWKTAYYSFVCPLTSGALLAEAPPAEIEALTRFGLLAGLAYQIRDDIIDLDPDRVSPDLGDIRDGKQTLPVWYAIGHCSGRKRDQLATILKKPHPTADELEQARVMIAAAGGIEYARREMGRCLAEAEKTLQSLSIGSAVRGEIGERIDAIFEIGSKTKQEAEV